MCQAGHPAEWIQSSALVMSSWAPGTAQIAFKLGTAVLPVLAAAGMKGHVVQIKQTEAMTSAPQTRRIHNHLNASQGKQGNLTPPLSWGILGKTFFFLMVGDKRLLVEWQTGWLELYAWAELKISINREPSQIAGSAVIVCALVSCQGMALGALWSTP